MLKYHNLRQTACGGAAALLLAACSAATGKNRGAEEEAEESRYYIYIPENAYDTEDMLGLYAEIIRLDYRGNRLAGGYMWMNSSHFDDCPDPHYPGFSVMAMDSLRVSADSLYFTLDTRKTHYFSAPIDIHTYSWQEAQEKGYYKCLQIEYFQDSVAFKARFAGDSIFFDMRDSQSGYNSGVKMTFRRISLDSLERIDRSISPEVELDNRDWSQIPDSVKKKMRDSDAAEP